MGPAPVVRMQPGAKLLAALVGVWVGPCVGPFSERGLDEAFGLAAGARGVGTGEAVLECKALAGGSHGSGTVGRSVVGQDGLEGDAKPGVVRQRSMQEGQYRRPLSSGSMAEKAMREWSSMATCTYSQPAPWTEPRRW